MRETSITDLVKFSFDDLIDILYNWKLNSKLTMKQKIMRTLRPKEVLFHINISGYATQNKTGVLEKIRRVKRDHPEYRMKVAQAYNDIRLSLKDSLQSVLQLENDFPYYEYKVMNLADYALNIHPETNIYPNIGYMLGSVELSVASSYHTAMLTTVFGIPSFLMSDNEFYSQKRRALGFGNDFGKFIENPERHMNNFVQERQKRAVWHKDLDKVVKTIQRTHSKKPIRIKYGKLPQDLPILKYRSPNS